MNFIKRTEDLSCKLHFPCIYFLFYSHYKHICVICNLCRLPWGHFSWTYSWYSWKTISGQRLNQQGTIPTHLQEKLHIWLSKLHLTKRNSFEMKTFKIIMDNLNDEWGIQITWDKWGCGKHFFYICSVSLISLKTPQKPRPKSRFSQSVHSAAILGISRQLFPLIQVQLPFTWMGKEKKSDNNIIINCTSLHQITHQQYLFFSGWCSQWVNNMKNLIL